MPVPITLPPLLPAAAAARDAENETREKLVAAAESLFALHGYREALGLLAGAPQPQSRK